MKLPLLAGLLVLACAVPAPLCAQDDYQPPKSPADIAGYDWEANARSEKLTDEQIDQLKQQGFVFVGHTYRQIFEPYIFGSQVFITSDTVINAYSVLLEDSVLRMERLNARRMRKFLEFTWKELDGMEKRIPGDKKLAADAVTRDRLVIGVALQLSTGEKVKASPELAAKIDEEARRVIAAEGLSKPAWLGKADDGFQAIDYTRFKPRGFYAGKTELERYFRATGWLQAIPFRVADDVEFSAFLILFRLAHDTARTDQSEWGMQVINNAYDRLLGKADSGDLFYDRGTLFDLYTFSLDSKWLAAQRDALSKETQAAPQINDQVAVPGRDETLERSMRILSARRVPDALLFAKTEQARNGAYPGGLELATLLGSPTARKLLEAKNPELLKAVDAEIKTQDSARDPYQPMSLYSEFLDTLALLFQPPDKAAPEVFRSPEWGFKSLQTVLGGWAQARHAWTLQTKPNAFYGSESIPIPCGFVEPVPDFFDRMSLLAKESAIAFDFPSSEDANRADAIDQLNILARSLKQDPKQSELSMDDEEAALNTWYQLIDRMAEKPKPGTAQKMLAAFDLWQKDRPALAERVDRLVHHFEAEPLTADERDYLHDLYAETGTNWYLLSVLCAKVEALCQKQLREAPFSKDDIEFMTNYGQHLGHIMFYGGNSYEIPRDDAMRICDVYTNPREAKAVEVGIGRPMQIYVLYPYLGKKILVHGAVSTYYEFANDTRLTDTEWKALLESPKPPKPALVEWIQALSLKQP